MKKNTTFSYVKGNSIIHKCPSWIKILFIPFLNILFLNLPFQYCIGLIIFQFLLCFLLHFTFKQQMEDIKPALYYAGLLLFMNFLIFLFSKGFNGLTEILKITYENPMKIIKAAEKNETTIMLLKLFCVMQSTSIFFKTSTSLQIRQGLEAIELFIRKILHVNKKCTVSNAVSMFIIFIPMMWQIWNELKTAWFARKGKNGIKMFLNLMPVLFSVGLKKAWNTARAVSIRSLK